MARKLCYIFLLPGYLEEFLYT